MRYFLFAIKVTDSMINGSIKLYLHSLSQKKLPPPSITDYHSSTHRLVRRVEALEVKLATTVPQKVIHRLTRRIEALESRLPPTLIKSIENSSKREEELKQQVKSLQTAFKLLEDQVKKMQKEFTQVPEDDDYEHMKPGVCIATIILNFFCLKIFM